MSEVPTPAEEPQENVSSPPEEFHSEPWEKIDLPSRFLPYTFKELWIRPFKAGEVKRLKALLNGNTEIRIEDIISSVMSQDCRDLITGDFWYVCAWVRLNTFTDSPLISEWECPSCNTRNTSVIQLSKLPIVELPKEYKEPVILPLSNGEEALMRLPRFGDYEVAVEFLNKLKNGKYTAEDVQDAELALQLQNDKFLKNNLDFLEKITEECSPTDLLNLMEFSKAFPCGLPGTHPVSCSQCEDGAEVRLNFTFRDILPLDSRREHIRDAVRFS